MVGSPPPDEGKIAEEEQDTPLARRLALAVLKMSIKLKEKQREKLQKQMAEMESQLQEASLASARLDVREEHTSESMDPMRPSWRREGCVEEGRGGSGGDRRAS